MKLPKIVLAVMFGGAILSTGCSSMVSKSVYPVAINSEPDGSSFTITNRNGDEVATGTTPTTLSLSAKAKYFVGELYTLTFSKPGYETYTYELKAGIDGFYFGNIIFGGLIGMLIVDPATGNMFQLPTNVNVSLTAIGSAENQAISFATIDSLSEEDKKRLVPISFK